MLNCLGLVCKITKRYGAMSLISPVLGLTEAKVGARIQPLPPTPQAAMSVKTHPTFALRGLYSGGTISEKERDAAIEQLRLEVKTVRYEYIHAGASSSDFQG